MVIFTHQVKFNRHLLTSRVEYFSENYLRHKLIRTINPQSMSRISYSNKKKQILSTNQFSFLRNLFIISLKCPITNSLINKLIRTINHKKQFLTMAPVRFIHNNHSMEYFNSNSRMHSLIKIHKDKINCLLNLVSSNS
jgi:hypothetical protein